MYQVLLVDDEPLILSGIKFMISWQDCGCQIAGTARNGQQALTFIQENRPAIVICDISMPLMSGTDLLEIVHRDYPETVFIMLTNYQDFPLIQQCLRCSAVDYLLKSQLDPESLTASLQKACAVYDRRRQISAADSMKSFLQSSQNQLLENALLELLHPTRSTEKLIGLQVLLKNHVLENYTCIYIPLDYSVLPECEKMTEQERRELFQWQYEVTENLAQNSFPKQMLLSLEEDTSALYLFVWQISPEAWSSQLSLFTGKLRSASSTITRLGVSVLAAPPVSGSGLLDQARKNLFELSRQYYLLAPDGVPDCSCPLEYAGLGLHGLGARLKNELNEHSIAGCEAVLERVIHQIETIPHKREQALWICKELTDTAEECMGSEYTLPLSALERATTRRAILAWLNALRDTLQEWNAKASGDRLEHLEKARQYVRDHADQRIMLQEAADYAFISPSYLSALHKKVYGQNFVDYIHQVKIQRACQMIREGNYKIYEVAEKLSIENAYYFTRIFKRYVGMTPREYQKKYCVPEVQQLTEE